MGKRIPDSEPWERQPGESVRNYEYFCAYRDMRYTPGASAEEPPKLELSRPRSLRNLAVQLGKSKQMLGDLSTRFNCQMRCDAYDLYILRRQRDQNEIRVLKMLDNHAAAGEQFWKGALRRLLSIPQDEIKAGDMVRMFEIGVKVERLSRTEDFSVKKDTSENANERSLASMIIQAWERRPADDSHE